MAHTVREKSKLLVRVRRIKGQAEALERALDSEADCAATLQQIAAIRGAVNGLMLEILEGHIRDHLGSPATTANARERDPGAGVEGSSLVHEVTMLILAGGSCLSIGQTRVCRERSACPLPIV